MPTEPIPDFSGERTDPDHPAAPIRPVNLSELGLAFFHLGATTFGGMWAATQQLEEVLVRRKAWLSIEQQHALMLAATLIPAPRFLAFGAMVGFQLRGWPGSLVSVAALIAPGAIFVLLGVMLLNPDTLGAPLVPVRRAVGIAIVGLLLGNAYHQLRDARVTGRRKAIGITLAVSVAAATITGIPLLVASLAGFALGALLIRPDTKEAT